MRKASLMFHRGHALGNHYGNPGLMIYISRMENYVLKHRVLNVPKLLQCDGDFDAIRRLSRVKSNVRVRGCHDQGVFSEWRVVRMVVAESCLGLLVVYIQVAFVSQSGVRGGAAMTTLGRLEMPLPRRAMYIFSTNPKCFP